MTDDSIQPLVGAEVSILDSEHHTFSDAGGMFSFSLLAPGKHQLAVQKLGYESQARVVEVTAGEVVQVNFALAPLAITEAYYVSQQGVGRFGCGFSIRGVVGLAACAATYGTPLNSTDKFRVDFHLTAENISSVQSIVMETAWKSTQAMAGGFTVYWHIYQLWGAGTTTTEPSRQFASVSGNSPIKTSVDDDPFKSYFKEKPPPKFCIKDGKCSIFGRIFPFAGTLGPGYPTDASVYLDQPYTHYVTEFFGEPAPEKFTILPDA